MIRISISNSVATVTETEVLAAGRVGLECAFTFGAEWSGLAKVAVFEGAETIEVALGTSDVAVVPPECMSTPGYNLRIGAYGLDAGEAVVIPTVWAKAGKIKDSAAPDDESFAPATPELVAQIIQTSNDAIDIARRIEAEAAAGDFDGVSPEATVTKSGKVATISITDRSGTTSATVSDGASAYEQAVEGGYVGSEEDFNTDLASFKDLATQAAYNAGVASDKAADASTDAGTATTRAAAAAADALKAEGHAVGKQNGTDVGSGSTYYHNNAAYYAGQASTDAGTAATKAGEASGSASSASTNALKAEGHAVGKQNGEDVGSGSPYYHANAAYYAGEASGSATSAGTDALAAEGFAVGEQGGVEVESGSPYYENNAKYYCETAEAVAASIPEDYTALTAEVAQLGDDFSFSASGADEIDVTEFSEVGYTLLENGTFYKISSTKSRTIPRGSEWGGVRVKANSTLASYVSFFKATPPATADVTNGDSAADYLCVGEPGRHRVRAGKTGVFVIPNDCTYIIIATRNASGTATPSKTEVLTPVNTDVVTSREDIQSIQTTNASQWDALDAVATRNIYSEENLRSGYYLKDDGTEASAANAAYTENYIPVDPASGYCFKADLDDVGNSFVIRIHQYAEDQSWISMAVSYTVPANATGSLSTQFTTNASAAFVRVSIGAYAKVENVELVNSVDGIITAIDTSARDELIAVEETVDGLAERTEKTESVGNVAIGGIDAADGSEDDEVTDAVRTGYIGVWPGDVVGLSDYGRRNGFAFDCFEYATTSTYTDHEAYIGQATVTGDTYEITNLNCAFVRLVVSNSGLTPAEENLDEFEAAVQVIRNQRHYVSDFLFAQPLQTFEDFFESATEYDQANVTAAEMLAKFDAMANLFTDEGLTNGKYLNDSGAETSAGFSAYTDYIPVEASTDYCFHAAVIKTSGTTRIRIHLYDSNKDWIEMATSKSTSGSTVAGVDAPFTTTAATAYIRISFGNWGRTTGQVLVKSSAETLSMNGNFRKIASGTDSAGNDLAAYRYRPRTKGYENYHVFNDSVLTPFRFPKIMVVGNIHGSERSPTFSLLKLVELLTGNAHVNDAIDFIRNNVEIVMVPLSNPSGWNAKKYENSNNKNLNRDFPPYGNFSQNETQFIRDVFNAETGIDFFFDFHNCWWDGPNGGTGPVNEGNIRSMPQLGYVYTDSPLWQKLGCNIYSMFKTRVNAAAESVVIDWDVYCESARKGTSAVWAQSRGVSGTLFEIARLIPNLDNTEWGNDVIIFGVNLLCSFIMNGIYTLRLPE